MRCEVVEIPNYKFACHLAPIYCVCFTTSETLSFNSGGLLALFFFLHNFYNNFGTGCSVLSRAFEWEKLAMKKSAT